mmetsp:Transcript_32659/g.55053  ORF Transcript_32659/g.55053 Transcript_32659/m.55053 type:complete len:239 (+) Transcript_32659:863-1579(+)
MPRVSPHIGDTDPVAVVVAVPEKFGLWRNLRTLRQLARTCLYCRRCMLYVLRSMWMRPKSRSHSLLLIIFTFSASTASTARRRSSLATSAAAAASGSASTFASAASSAASTSGLLALGTFRVPYNLFVLERSKFKPFVPSSCNLFACGVVERSSSILISSKKSATAAYSSDTWRGANKGAIDESSSISSAGGSAPFPPFLPFFAASAANAAASASRALRSCSAACSSGVRTGGGSVIV